MIGAPVLNGAFDIALGLELSAERPPRQLRNFIVGREAQRDQLAGRQFADPTPEIGWQYPLEPRPLLETNGAILSAQGHRPRRPYTDRERDRQHHNPACDEAWMAHEFYDGDDD